MATSFVGSSCLGIHRVPSCALHLTSSHSRQVSLRCLSPTLLPSSNANCVEHSRIEERQSRRGLFLQDIFSFNTRLVRCGWDARAARRSQLRSGDDGFGDAVWRSHDLDRPESAAQALPEPYGFRSSGESMPIWSGVVNRTLDLSLENYAPNSLERR